MLRRSTAHRPARIGLWILVVFFATLGASTGCTANDDASGPSVRTSDRLSVHERVRITVDIKTWLSSIEARGQTEALRESGYTECAAVEELEGAQVCASSSPSTMNTALLRASLYAEGNFGATKGEIASLDDAAYRIGMSSAGGHDLRGEQLAAFWDALTRACSEKGPRYCPMPGEQELFEAFILPHIADGHPFVVIAFPSSGADAVIGHEILHAQYFLAPAFRDATDAFWATRVRDEDKAAIRRQLAFTYDVTDELLVRNEFMAYLLTRGPLLGAFGTYAGPLTDALIQAGAPPLRIP